MSSSGKGQTFIRSAEQLAHAWEYAQQGGRAGAGRVIVEGVVKFDFEITLLTVSAVDGVHFCAPVGHRQEDGDYRESWQPQQMSPLALERAQEIARKVVLALGGYGLFGVELFVCGDEVIFSEVSLARMTPDGDANFRISRSLPCMYVPSSDFRLAGSASMVLLLLPLSCRN